MISPIKKGSVFTKYYARLESGKLSLFKNQEAYDSLIAPVVEPFSMIDYRLVTDPDEIASTTFSPGLNYDIK